MEGMMDILAEKVGVDGWDIRERNILNPGEAFGTGQIMRESVRGIREKLEAVKDVYKRAKYKGIACGLKSTGLGNGTIEGGYIKIRVVRGGPGGGARLAIFNGYTELGQGVYTATMQAVCEETGLPAGIMTVAWDKDLGEKCGETWASRATTLSCAAAQRAGQKLAADLKEIVRLTASATVGSLRDPTSQCWLGGPPSRTAPAVKKPDTTYETALEELVGREY
jgi:xanthine dehydrogenase molybdenum-binding subunit